MKAVVQRVSRASVKVDEKVTGEIGPGLVAFVGFGRDDDEQSLQKMARKIANLRVFEDRTSGKMTLSVNDIAGGVLVVSNFTLYGDAMKGNRPNFSAAAPVDKAEKLYTRFLEILSPQAPNVQAGVFQAMMDVDVFNDGPVTIIIQT